MKRFAARRQPLSLVRPLIWVLVLALILGLAVFFFGRVNEGSIARQQESLERALERSITYCYASEGSYPPSLDYIREHYGLSYDEDLFFVDYRVQGSNIYPDFTIIRRT